MLDLPPLPRRLLSLLVRPFSPILSSRLSPAPPASALDVWRLNAEAAAAADGTLRAWRAAGVDAVLCNGCPMPAAPAGMADRLFDTFNLGCGFNLINFPAGTVRVSTESEQDQEELNSYPGGGVAGRRSGDDLVHDWVRRGTRGALGMPLSVQVAARPWCEELVVRILRELEEYVRENGYD